jgi:DNA replication and repair protein RecF
VLIESITFFHFRNFASLHLDHLPSLCVLKGENGQGKTNFIEALVVLSQVKSPRTSHSSELITFGSERAEISAKIIDSHGPLELSIEISKRGRVPRVQGTKVKSLKEYLGRMVTLSFFPQEVSLIKGGPAERREFLFKLLIDARPSMASTILDYFKALQQKNALLQSYPPTPRDDVLLWNSLLVEHGIIIQKELTALVQDLETKVQAAYRTLAPHEDSVRLTLESRKEFPGESSEALRFLELCYPEEVIKKRAVYGPHRLELYIELMGKSARAYASQGQARSLVLALKIASVEFIEEVREESPILLLDDVESELDKQRSEAFFSFLHNGKRQIVISCTDKASAFLSDTYRPYFFHVEKGTVSRE